MEMNYKQLTDKYGMRPENYTFNFLDTIDLTKYLEEHDEPWKAMQAIDTDYSNSKVIKEAYDIFEGNVFNWISDDEFADYVNERYKDDYRIVEEVKYKIRKIK